MVSWWSCHLEQSKSNYRALCIIISYRYEVCVLGITHGHYGVNFFYQLLFLFVFEFHVPFCQSRFSRAILYKNEANLWRRTVMNMFVNTLLKLHALLTI